MGNPAAASLRKAYPDYDQFTAADFKRVPDSIIGSILSSYSFRRDDADEHMPASFRARYGNNARFEFVHTLMNEAASRRDAKGNPTSGLPQAWVSIALLQAGVSGSAEEKINPVFPITLEGTKGESIVRQVTPPSLLTYDLTNIVLDMIGTRDQSTETIVPLSPDAIAALQKVNPKYKPGPKIPEFIIGDEGAVMTGYAFNRGYAADVGYIEIVTNSKEVCKAEATAIRALTPNQPELPVIEAWKAGYLIGEIDKKFKEMRTASNPTDREAAEKSFRALFADCPDKIPTTSNVMTSLAPGTTVTPLSTGLGSTSQVLLTGAPGS